MAHEVDAAQVYALLQTSPHLGPEEIARRLDGEPESVRRCLRLLGELSLLRPGEEGFTVVRPETGMTILLARAQAQAAGAAASGGTAPAGRGEAPAPGGIPISPREWQVLQLLAQGCTDEAVARSLSVSLRTVRRVTADLMTRLEARSRFQAGLKSYRIFAERGLNRTAQLGQAHSRALHHLNQNHNKRHRPAVIPVR